MPDVPLVRRRPKAAHLFGNNAPARAAPFGQLRAPFEARGNHRLCSRGRSAWQPDRLGQSPDSERILSLCCWDAHLRRQAPAPAEIPSRSSSIHRRMRICPRTPSKALPALSGTRTRSAGIESVLPGQSWDPTWAALDGVAAPAGVHRYRQGRTGLEKPVRLLQGCRLVCSAADRH
jgi:hypothetical protein